MKTNPRKKIGDERANELDAMSSEQLKQTIYEANQAMQQVVDELEANAEYQALLESKKAMESGKSEVFSRQKATIGYALQCINKES